jgi:hypothetical protein
VRARERLAKTGIYKRGSRYAVISIDGKVMTDFAAGADAAEDVALGQDGKIVVSGPAHAGAAPSDFGVARYLGGG